MRTVLVIYFMKVDSDQSFEQIADTKTFYALRNVTLFF